MIDGKIRIIYPPDSLFTRLAPFPPTYGYRMIGTQWRLILRDYPYTLYSRTETGAIKWLGFIYAFLYWNKEGKQVLRLERLTAFREEEDLQEQIYSRLLNECTRLAQIMRVDCLEVAVYRKIGGEICFPSTMSYFNSYNPPETRRFFTDIGFQPKETQFVFSLPSRRLQEGEIPQEKDGYTITQYTQSSLERRSYWSLWSESPYCVERLRPQEDWELDYGMKMARDPRYVFFAWKNDEIIGFIHWLPNFYKVDVQKRRVKSSEWLINHPNHVKKGKIFKVTINPEYESQDIRLKLCLHAMKTMWNDFRLDEIHIGNIRSDDEHMVEVIKELGGQQLHILEVMEIQRNTDK